MKINEGRRTVNGTYLTPAEWAIWKTLLSAKGLPLSEDAISKRNGVIAVRWHISAMKRKGIPVENLRGHGYRATIGDEEL